MIRRFNHFFKFAHSLQEHQEGGSSQQEGQVQEGPLPDGHRPEDEGQEPEGASLVWRMGFRYVTIFTIYIQFPGLILSSISSDFNSDKKPSATGSSA